MKSINFLGPSRLDIRGFPDDARREIGIQLDRLQRGLDPKDWKPMKTVGPNVRELRVRESAGAFRVVYVATFDDAVYVLHAFQKKTEATSKLDLERASKRFRELVRSMGDDR